MALPDDRMQEREAEKAEALAEIAVALNQMDAEHRHPDRWERVCLVHAFAAVFSGCYSLAATEAGHALLPPAQRSPKAMLTSDTIFDQCDLPLLWRVFRAARAEPASRFPHFGPVELKVTTIKNPGKAWLP